MSLQFIIGTGDVDHELELVHQANEWLDKSESHEVIFLVPNYNKFERELELLREMKRSKQQEKFSSIRTQVFSFQRLAWYFLQNSNSQQKMSISDIGARMLMRKVLTEHKKELRLFSREVDKQGFIQQLLDLYLEFQQGGLTTVLFQELMVKISDNKTELNTKLSELMTIFSLYEQSLFENHVQVNQPISELIHYLSNLPEEECQKGSNTLYIVTGYSSFLSQEQQLISTLMQIGHVRIDLIADQLNQNENPLDLFYDANQLYTSLIQTANQLGVKVMFDVKLTGTSVTARSEVEAFWRLSQNRGTYNALGSMDDYLSIWKVETPQEELRQVGLEIKKLISGESGGEYTYKDIQLLTLDPETYFPFIPTIFGELGIPYYLDEDKKMIQHPIVHFLETLFDLDFYRYRLSDIVRLLRTELYIPSYLQSINQDWVEQVNGFRELVDITENICLANNFQGVAWQKKNDWHLFSYDFEEEREVETQELERMTNQLRQAFKSDIIQSIREIKKSQTFIEAAHLFYTFLEKIGIENELIHWRDQALLAGDLDAARNHEQIWGVLMSILDEFVSIYGETIFEWSIFTDLIKNGLETVTFGKIPSSIDQVKINRLDLARPSQAKISFAIGLTDASFPRKVENKTLLDTNERTQLNEYIGENGFIRDRAKETSQKEPYVAYSVFLSATDHVYASFPASSETDQSVKPSVYLKRFLESKAITGLVEKKLLTSQSDVSDHVGSYRGLIRQISQLEREKVQNSTQLPTVWQQLKKRISQSSYQQLAERVFESEAYQNEPITLSKEQAIQLYGKDIYSSVSRLETFNHCEYRFFTQYGLKLKERDIYGLTPAMTGEFFHEALDRFMKVLIEKNITLSTLTAEERVAFIQIVLKDIFGEKKFAVLQSSARMNFIYDQLSKTIQRMTWVFEQQGKRMNLTPVQTEVLFGQIAAKKGVSGLEIHLASQGKLYVRGKIDRIDQVQVDGQTYLSVIDYKSSDKKFSPSDAYYGLAMQLITYLEVALNNATKLVEKEYVKAGGAFYLHVFDPRMDVSETIDQDRIKKFKYEGIFVNDQALFPEYDKTLLKSKTSDIFPIRQDKDEQYQMGVRSENRFYSQKELDTLFKHNHKKMKESADKLQGGTIELNPTLDVSTQERACRFCPFRSVCAFDPMLKENNYTKLYPLNKEESLKQMEAEKDE